MERMETQAAPSGESGAHEAPNTSEARSCPLDLSSVNPKRGQAAAEPSCPVPKHRAKAPPPGIPDEPKAPPPARSRSLPAAKASVRVSSSAPSTPRGTGVGQGLLQAMRAKVTTNLSLLTHKLHSLRGDSARPHPSPFTGALGTLSSESEYEVIHRSLNYSDALNMKSALRQKLCVRPTLDLC